MNSQEHRISERIVAAAVFVGGVIVSAPRPGRHHTVLHALHRLGIEDPGPNAQGFLTDDGRWLDRQCACEVAREAGQIIKKEGPDHILFSEDMW